VVAAYRGRRVASMAPPSSGGIALVETLQILERRELGPLGHNSSAYLHVVAEALKHAFADRARHLGDPEFVKVPEKWLHSREDAEKVGARIGDRVLTDHEAYGTGVGARELRDAGTSHLSVVDAEGNAVALTTTVNLLFGSCVVGGSTGVVLNDQMDDF